MLGGITYSYQWVVNGQPVAGANVPSYVVRPADDGFAVHATVTARDAYNSASVDSDTFALLDDDLAPDAELSNTLAERQAGYVGAGIVGLDVLADDDPDAAGGTNAGVQSITLQRNGTVLGTRIANCATACPTTFSGHFEVDPPEGENDFVVVTRDAARNEASDRLVVLVDRTAPEAPQRVRLMDYDAAASTVTLDWIEGADPDLPGGEPGAGTKYTEYRRQAADGSWGEWHRFEDASEATLNGVRLGQVIDLELRAIDPVGNTSPVEAVEFTVQSEPETDSPGSAAIGPDSCTPRLDYARARNTDPDYHHFEEIRTVLGAQLQVYCILTDPISPTRSLEITAWLSYDTGQTENGAPVFKRVGIATPITVEPRNKHDVKVRGINADCEPQTGGTRHYIVTGTIKYIRDRGVDVTHDFHTDIDSTAALTCPSAFLREQRRVAGWTFLKRYSADYNSNPAKRTRHDPSFWLGDALGDRPYNPPGTTPGRSWEAHHIVPVKLPAADPIKAMMFRCSVHPNARENGVYLRGIDVKRTRRDGSSNPRYEALKAHDAGLAARTYHGDTFRSIYISHLSAALHDSLALGERCPSVRACQRMSWRHSRSGWSTVQSTSGYP